MATAVDDIERFAADLKAAGGAAFGEAFEDVLPRFYRSDDPAVIDACDAIRAVIRKNLSLRARAAELLPILDTLGRALPA